MRCPACEHDADRVIDSRSADRGAAVRRRRQCGSCGERFSTLERVEPTSLSVRKRGGSLEPFDAAKLSAGVAKATTNLPLAPEAAGQVATHVESRLRRLQQREISTERIGAEVLEALRSLNEVAYMRFASVYKGFTSPEDFRRELATLEKRDPPKRGRGAPAGPRAQADGR